MRRKDSEDLKDMIDDLEERIAAAEGLLAEKDKRIGELEDKVRKLEDKAKGLSVDITYLKSTNKYAAASGLSSGELKIYEMLDGDDR